MLKSDPTRRWLFFGIIVIALFLRTFRITAIPPALSWDEVSIGYNAYSILRTGFDEHHQFMPLAAFAGYGDYKPPLSIYLTVPTVALLGLTELAVRLPSAIFGTLTVFLTYFLVRTLFVHFGGKKSQSVLETNRTETVALLTAAVLTVSPWHINLSRAGFEANIAVFFVVLGICVLFETVRHPKLWTVAWLPFLAAAYTFNSARYLVPILGAGMLVILYRQIRLHIRLFTAGVLVAVLCAAPLIPHLLSKEARLRFNEVNIFTDPTIVETANTRIAEAGDTVCAKLIYNRRIGYARSFLIHFADNFSPDFLFISGDGNPKFSVRDVGQLYLVEAPLLAIGFFALLIRYPSLASFLLFWLIAAVIPAATARETPHALRVENSLPVWQIFIAYGIMTVVSWADSLGKRRLAVAAGAGVFLLYAFNVSYYLHDYYVHYPVEYAGEWEYGYKQALAYANAHAGEYDTIYMTDAIGRPYMYALFYGRVDPAAFWKTKQSYFDAAGFYHVDGFGKFRFVSTMPAGGTGHVLYIASGSTAPHGATVLETVKLPDGKPTLTLYTD